MRRILWTMSAVLVSLATGCSAVPTITAIASDQVATPSAAEIAVFEINDPPPSTEELSISTEEEPTAEPEVAATTAPNSAAASGSQAPSEPWDAAIKQERRDDYERLRRQVHDVFAGSSTDDVLPDPVINARALGDTAQVVATFNRPGATQDPLVIRSVASADRTYVHSSADRPALASYLSEQHRWIDPGDIDFTPGIVETVQLVQDGTYASWSRGLTLGLVQTDGALPVDVDGWYASGSAVSGILRADAAFLSPDELWETLDAEPQVTRTTTGRTIYEASLPEARRVASAIGVASWPTNEAASVTVTATYSPASLLERIGVTYVAEPLIDSVTFVVESRGEPVEVPQITDGRALPTYSAPKLSAEEYSWTATGTFREEAQSPLEGPWTAKGRVQKGFYAGDYLAMTAGDVKVLGQLPEISVPDDHLVQRWGFDWITTMGLFAELAPPWTDASLVEHDLRYSYDPFKVPANLFPHGLGDQRQWVELRTVPEIVELDGWTNHRVSTGTIDTEYWNYRSREKHGFFAWMVAEDATDIFVVTIGADVDGKLERFEIRTTDIDGGGLLFDVRLDPITVDGIKWSDARRGGSLRVDASYVPEETTDEPRPPFEDFASASRDVYPVFDHSRSPEHLTILTRQVKDEPSGAYTPAGDFYRWPSVYFRNLIAGYLPGDSNDRIGVVCIDLDDNKWRYDESDFEKFWRGYEDGSVLDEQILRFNTNGWMSVDVYASDGERHRGDPCAEQG